MNEYTGMSNWKSITCQNPIPHEHRTFIADVDLSERHGYLNFAPIPERLWVPPFKMEVWDWEAAAEASMPVEGQWCPMRCAISQTIVEHGIWEPPETLALLNVFDTMRLCGEPWAFVDIGAQLGWFSILAMEAGGFPLPIEADPEVAEILIRNLGLAADQFGMTDVYDPEESVGVYRVGEDDRSMYVGGPVVVKIDIEGAEPAALRELRPTFERGDIRAALIETTPRFGVDVEAMAELMLGYGFDAYFLPHILDEEYSEFDSLEDLEYTASASEIARRAEEGRQINVLYLRSDFPLAVQ